MTFSFPFVGFAVADRPSEVYEFGDFRLDVGERMLELRQRRERVPIPEKAFRTLVHLVRNHGALVTRDAILSTVWPGTFVEEGNIGKARYMLTSYADETSEDMLWMYEDGNMLVVEAGLGVGF